MYIKELHISAFGPIVDRDLTFENSLNIVEGVNESGKSAIAAFIKFIFYGLSSRVTDGISEKQRYVNWERGFAAGYAVCATEEDGETKLWRIERTLSAKSDADGKVKYSEKVKVLDHETSMPVNIGSQPGDYFFGVPEAVFCGSAFASQEGDIKPDGTSLKESIENIICAADENINVKRAVDLLDRARVKLLHKNRTGGEIIKLEHRRDALEIRMAESKETSARLIRSEISLSDVKENIAQTASRMVELEKISAALEVLERESRLEKLVSLREKLAKTDSELASEAEKGLDERFMSTLALNARDVDRVAKCEAELEVKTENFRANTPAGELRDPEADLENAKRYSKKAQDFFFGGVFALVLGLLGIIGTGGAYMLAKGATFPVALATLAVLALGITMMILSGASRRRYFDVLDLWNAEDADELESITCDVSALSSEVELARATLASAKISGAEAEESVRALAASAGVASGTAPVASLIKLLAKMGADSAQRKKTLEAERSRLEGQISAAEASLEGVPEADIRAEADAVRQTEAGKAASALDEGAKAAISREALFIKTKSENLREREIELERECAALRAVNTSPATDAEELEKTLEEIAKLRRSHDALVNAADLIRRAGENIRLSVVPKLSEDTSRIMSGVSGGRYSSLGISPSFEMNFRDDEFGTLELDYLSAGTKDIAYIALRIALVKALYDEAKRPPVIFDESLAFLDEERVRAAVKMLEEQKVQTFLFTCRSLEASVAETASVTRLHR